jgi:hypothetical protein
MFNKSISATKSKQFKTTWTQCEMQLYLLLYEDSGLTDETLKKVKSRYSDIQDPIRMCVQRYPSCKSMMVMT